MVVLLCFLLGIVNLNLPVPAWDGSGHGLITGSFGFGLFVFFFITIEQFGCILGLSSLDLRLTKFSPRRICTINLSPFLNRESRSHRLAP